MEVENRTIETVIVNYVVIRNLPTRNNVSVTIEIDVSTALALRDKLLEIYPVT